MTTYDTTCRSIERDGHYEIEHEYDFDDNKVIFNLKFFSYADERYSFIQSTDKLGDAALWVDRIENRDYVYFDSKYTRFAAGEVAKAKHDAVDYIKELIVSADDAIGDEEVELHTFYTEPDHVRFFVTLTNKDSNEQVSIEVRPQVYSKKVGAFYRPWVD